LREADKGASSFRAIATDFRAKKDGTNGLLFVPGGQ
jgi:hypothetical protein